MEAINLLTRSPAQLTQNLKQDLTLMLGEILAARVHAKISSNTYQLQIRDTLLQVQSKQQLKQGDVLQLKVSQLNDPITLKIVDPKSARIENSETATLQQARQLLLRESLPRAKPLLPLFRHLFAKGSTSSNEGLHIPLKAQNTIKTLQQLVQGYQNLNRPAQVKQAMESSGLFFESRLAGQVLNGKRQSLPADIKSLLLKLAQQLDKQPVSTISGISRQQVLNKSNPQGQPAASSVTASANGKILAASDTVVVKGGNEPLQNGVMKPGQETPVSQRESARGTHSVSGEPRAVSVGELRQMVDSSLARIQLHQTQAVVSDGNSHPVWSAEIPVHNGKDVHSIGLTIAEDSRHNGEDQQSGWTVTLHLDLDHLGTVEVKIGLYGEQISASIWADCSETAELFQSHLEQLEKRLQRAGLQVNKLHCLQGSPPPGIARQMESLLDVML